MKLKFLVRFLVLCISTMMLGPLSGCGGGGGGGGGETAISQDISTKTTNLVSRDVVVNYLESNGYWLENTSGGTGKGWYLSDAGFDIIISANRNNYTTTINEVWSSFSAKYGMNLTAQQFCNEINAGYLAKNTNPLISIFHPDTLDISPSTKISSLQQIILIIEVTGAINSEILSGQAVQKRVLSRLANSILLNGSDEGKAVSLTADDLLTAGYFLRGLVKITVGTVAATAGGVVGIVTAPSGVGAVAGAGMMVAGFTGIECGIADVIQAGTRLLDSASQPSTNSIKPADYTTDGNKKANTVNANVSVNSVVTFGAQNTPLPGVTIKMNGTWCGLTDETGAFLCTGFSNNSPATVSATREGFSMSPPYKAVGISPNPSITTVNFVATPSASYSIEGNLNYLTTNNPVQGARIDLYPLDGRATISTTTDASGHYKFPDNPIGHYTMYPYFTGTSENPYQPTNKTFTITNADLLNKNFMVKNPTTTTPPSSTGSILLSWGTSSTPSFSTLWSHTFTFTSNTCGFTSDYLAQMSGSIDTVIDINGSQLTVGFGGLTGTISGNPVVFTNGNGVMSERQELTISADQRSMSGSVTRTLYQGNKFECTITGSVSYSKIYPK